LVLVIEDDPDVRRLLEKSLVGLPIRVDVREQSFGLLNTIAELKPNLVVLDVMMPGLDGTHLTQLVREDPELASTPIILFSALSKAELASRARECGADAFVEKTAGPRALVDEIRFQLEL
jgi:DNA-binding response OmpR family regulator